MIQRTRPPGARTDAAPASHALYGRALRDWFDGDASAALMLHSSLGEHDAIPAELFFRMPDAFFPFERHALDLCRGSVLDAGAGTGVHTLALQERGLRVTAVEIVPEAVGIMRARGVRDAHEADMFLWLDGGPPAELGRFDTVLMLMNGIGPVGTLERLARFLRQVAVLLAPGGQLLLDSGTVLAANADAAADDGWRWPARSPAGYPGEAWMRLEYRGKIGAPFRELYVDRDTLFRLALDAGWAPQTAFEDASGGYLARLVRS